MDALLNVQLFLDGIAKGFKIMAQTVRNVVMELKKWERTVILLILRMIQMAVIQVVRLF